MPALLQGLTRFSKRAAQARAFWAGDEVAPPPVELVVEVTNACNLACTMCPRSEMVRSIGHMDLDLFRSMVDQAAPHVELVQLAGGLGEPLSHPRLAEMVAWCRKRHVEVGISTNAALLDPARTTALLDAQPDILLFSLDGATKETHEAIRVGSDFEKTMGRVSAFLHAKAARDRGRRRRPPYTAVQMVTMPENEHEIEAFRARWEGHPGLDAVRYKRFKDLLSVNPRAAAGRDPHASCLLPWRQISVAWDGRVGLCCRDLDFQTIVGDLRTDSFLDVWNGPALRAMRRDLAAGRRASHALCAKCDIFESTVPSVTALTVLDGVTIRRLLPTLERGIRRLGRPIMGY